MPQKKDPNRVGGPDGITWEEHVKNVERYLDYQDPPTLLRRRLASRMMQTGFARLSDAEQTYYAMNQFLNSMFNVVEDHLEDEKYLRKAIARGFREFGLDCHAIEYEILCEKFDEGRLDVEDPECVAPFVKVLHELDTTLEQYAVDQGLHLG